jgi:hypothetical protein
LSNATWDEHGQAEIVCNAAGQSIYGTLWMNTRQALWASWVTASGGGSVSGA